MATETDKTNDRRLDPQSILTAVGFVLAVNLVGSAPSLVTGTDSAWFQALEKPFFYPPGWTFGIVWTLLFTLVGVALYLVVRRGLERRDVRLAVGVFVLQMLLNVAWTPTFFGIQAPLAALGVICVLLVLVVATIVAFDRVDRRAATLLLPYLVWVAFATVLTYSIWSLNA